MTKPTPDPTPAEIKAACLQIQSEWTPSVQTIATDESSRASEDVLSDLVASKAAVSDSVAFDEH